MFREAALEHGKNFQEIAKAVKTKDVKACARHGFNLKRKLEKNNTDPELYEILKINLNLVGKPWQSKWVRNKDGSYARDKQGRRIRNTKIKKTLVIESNKQV